MPPFSFSRSKYFYLPFLLWLVAGGIMLLSSGKKELFILVNGHNHALADVVMPAITAMGQVDIILPVLLSMFAYKRLRNTWYFFQALACSLVPFLVQQGLKRLFSYPRPLTYFNNATWIHRLPDWPELYHNSFPSGHTQGAFSFFCFLTLLLPEKLRGLGFVFFILALSVAYSRLYLAAHFFEDVYAGSIVGVVITTGVYIAVNRIFDTQKNSRVVS